MYQTKGSIGARIGACLLDGAILWVMIVVGVFISYGLGVILMLAGSVLYFGICEGSSLSASLGKKMCGLIVVDSSGNPLVYGKSFTRALCRLLSGLVFGIGFMIGLFDEKGLTLHDRLAGTFVADRFQVQQQKPTPVPNPGSQMEGVSMNPQIIGIVGQFAGRAFPIPPQGIMMGRDPAACDFVFSENTKGISRSHCKLQFNNQTQMFVLYDLGSSYGTFLGNGLRVPQGQPAALRTGDEFYLASRGNVFRVEV